MSTNLCQQTYVNRQTRKTSQGNLPVQHKSSKEAMIGGCIEWLEGLDCINGLDCRAALQGCIDG